MAGFENIVRPVVFPNIRPSPAQSIPAATAPDQGVATIRGASGKSIDLSHSQSISSQAQQPTETQRRVDEVRVYQMDDNGDVNRDNFVDMDVANKIWMNEGSGSTKKYYYTPVEEADNIEILNTNVVKKARE